MNEKEPDSHSTGLSINDIYFILFRHKWKILLCWLAGIAGAAAFYLSKPALYQSEAKLLVKYVQENKTVTPVKDDTAIQSPDASGLGIISSEEQILSSLDLSLQVADAVGPEKILAGFGGGNDRNVAALVINKNLTVETPNRSKVIRVIFQHPDPDLVQPVLRQLIDAYKKKHLEIHRSFGLLDDLLSQETLELRSRLNQTDEELRKIKSKLGVISLEETKRTLIEEMSRVRQEIFSSEAELEQHKAAVREAEKLTPIKSSAAVTNELGVPLKTLTEYKNLCAQLNSFLSKEQELLMLYTPENPLVQRVRAQVADSENAKKKIEEEHPKLLELSFSYAASASTGTNASPVDPAAELLHAKTLEAKIQALKGQLEKIKADAAKIEEAESAITQLERKKELEETYYRTFSQGLEQFRVDEALGAGKVTNIPVVQEPSPPVRSLSKLQKPLLLILLLGFGSGLGLAFVIELFLSPTIKRPIELEKNPGVPLMMSIPNLSGNGGFRGSPTPGWTKAAQITDGTVTKMELAPWEAQHGLRRYSEALRDRLVTYFELHNMTHKPKLVAVTSCSRGAGVTTIATGLAAALSETGDGNVLLVDMGLEQGAAHAFYKGKPGCGLSEVLESRKREDAMVQDNLYMVTAQNPGDQLPRVLPKKFTNLVPKMKASEFDYIIFDMPAISQTSITSALAGFMDMMLVVVESEKSNREAVSQALSRLSERKHNVSTVLNKTRQYLPGWLHQEL